MDLCDVNVLIYAHRAETPDHGPCRNLMAELLNGPRRFAVYGPILAGFVRVATLPVWKPPTPLATALEFCRLIEASANAIAIAPGPGHAGIWADLCLKSRAAGNLVWDAWLAALAIEHGCTLISADADFARFSGLVWRHPAQTG